MATKKPLEFTLDVICYPLLFVFIAWVVFWIETRFKINLNYLGILPQKAEGLRGIFLAPFIHSSLKHLFNNSIPLLVLGSALFYFYRNIRWKIFFLGFLLTGLLTWLIGRPALHIGGSGIVYLLASFLFFKGILSKQYQLTALALVVVFLYGSLLWYLFPIDPKISWEGHLSGFLVGFVLALFFRKNPVENKKFEWEKDSYNEEDDDFMNYFDDDGNFIEMLPEVEEPDDIPTSAKEDETSFKITVNYSYKSSSDTKGTS
ncbi:rhomboid family intramembrane serine protease [Rasiella sp. SM2506]|uniref:rhomboid family intramembrane serine protease n=1 Tax=Rasiella sp. SM2506 TaxID=3423914 RepID=UPI003D7B5D5D